MEMNRLISAFVSASLTLSIGAGVFTVDSKTAQAQTTEVDYIGSSTQPETFDDYKISGGVWNTNYGMIETSGGFDIIAVNDGKYVSGKVLATRTRGGDTSKTAAYDMTTAVSSGKLYFSADIQTSSVGAQPAFDGGNIALTNSKNESVVKISIPKGNKNIKVQGIDSYDSKYTVDPRAANPYELKIAIIVNLDKNTAQAALVYDAANGTTNYTDTIDFNINDTDIAGLDITVNSNRSSVNQDIRIDNVKFYSTSVDAWAKNLSTLYNSNGKEVNAYTTDISDNDLSSGESYTYYVPAYIDTDSGLYKTAGDKYNRTTELNEGTTTVSENVELAVAENYQYAEFDGSVPYASRSENASNGEVYNIGAGDHALLTAEQDGIYTVTVATAQLDDGTDREGTIKIDDKVILSDPTLYSSYPKVFTVSNVHIDKGASVVLTGHNSHSAVDYVLIERTGDYEYPEASYSQYTRKMEKMGRGLFAVDTGSGVYLSWRLLGTESLSNQAFDIYCDGKLIYTTGVHEATNYTDTSGSASSSYIVVPEGESISGEQLVKPISSSNYTKHSSSSGYSLNKTAYFDIPITAPAAQVPAGQGTGTEGSAASGSDTTATGGEEGDNTGSEDAATYTANDASVGDLDGDGEYEIILKWNPSNAKDNSKSGFTSNTYIDAYEMANSDGKPMWRIDLGSNIRSGAHYTQFIVYDFDNDGKSEIAMKTAPGTKDGTGEYVNSVMDRALTDEDNNANNFRNQWGYILNGPEYITIFDGETGKALATTDFITRGMVADWGDSYGNRVDRFNATVAYLDGRNPSLIFARGYYEKAVMAAYNWDGYMIRKLWLHEGLGADNGTLTTYNNDNSIKSTEALSKTIYAEGNHSIGVCDADNDGRDEIVFGSAVVDDNGSALCRTGHGHGDAHHINDFNNDGRQEVFNVHESKSISGQGYAAEYWSACDGTTLSDTDQQAKSADNGRGIMGNMLDDADKFGLSQYWSASIAGIFSEDKTKGTNGRLFDSFSGDRIYCNFTIQWDGDLAAELLDGHQDGGGYLAELTSEGKISRFIWDTSTFPGVLSNNSTKANPCLSADILGDWREEVIYRKSDGTGLRVFVTALPTRYRLHTLMHDAQYREGVATENVGYNQPPHTSYYIGSAALAKDANTGEVFNYLIPETAYTKVEMVKQNALPVVDIKPAESFSKGEVYSKADQNGDTQIVWDAAITNTITLPDDTTVDANEVRIKVGNADATLSDSFKKRIKNMTGGVISFTVGIIGIPDRMALGGVKVSIEVGDISQTATVDIE